MANSHDDDNGIMDYLKAVATSGYIESQCQAYLDVSTYRHMVRFDSEGYKDELELYAPVGSFTIQKIIDDHRDFESIHLQRPAPSILPIIISKISNDSNSYIIPSSKLNIDAILPRAPSYQLEGIICEINQHHVIFMKRLTTNKWYYYQNEYTCEQFNDDLSQKLNQIIESKSVKDQIRLIQSAHFLISMIFNNVVKYIYKQEET